MDDVYSVFIDTIGPPIHKQEVPPSTIERYRRKLPKKLLEHWTTHGWCGYGDGIFGPSTPKSMKASLHLGLTVRPWPNMTPTM